MKHEAKYIEEPGLIDEIICSCGWKSGPFYDGAEFAYARWLKHAAGGTESERSPEILVSKVSRSVI